jgi:hypothetical protein
MVNARNESQAKSRNQKNKISELTEAREQLEQVQMKLADAQRKLAHEDEVFKQKQLQLDITHDQI